VAARLSLAAQYALWLGGAFLDAGFARCGTICVTLSSAAKIPVLLRSPPKTLARITILLPVYKEANMLAQLADMLSALDYPAAKFQCLLLVEADDRETAQVAMETTWPSFLQIMSLPKGVLKTKPRACNLALARALGDILMVFDAEDRPHPQQLREAAARFKGSHANLACVQAPLEVEAQAGN
jgi:cellulose synthase/poly-beta-1,6-N-acetylglucosamine synthase-like glycosyltransferase